MFSGAVSEASGDRTKTKYSVRGQGLFNAVVLACLQDLLPVVHKVSDRSLWNFLKKFALDCRAPV